MNDINSDDSPPQHAEERASFLSKITFFWLIELFKFGRKHQITASDIFGVRRHDASARLSRVFSALWKSELDDGGGSLWRVIWRAFGLRIALSGLLFSIVDTVVRLLQPQLLGAFVKFFVPNQTGIGTRQAIYFAAGTVLCSFIPAIVFHPFFLYVLNIGQRIRIACCSLLYKKVLREPRASTKMHAAVTSLISRDMSKLDYAIATCHEIYRAPLEALLIAYFVYAEGGVAGLAGIVSMMAFVPLLFYIAEKSTVYRSRAAQHTEGRVRLMSEIIERIAVIKTFCMEQVYAKMIKERRRSEVAMARGVLYLRATSISLGLLLKLALFVCLASNADNRFSASSVYIILAYYSMLFTSMLQFWPLLVTNARDACRTVEKARQLLTLENTEKEEEEEEEICRDDGSTEKLMMSRRPPRRSVHEEADVKGISMRNVVTRAGVRCDFLDVSEYSSRALVNATPALFEILLGENALESGEIDISGSISYASQHSWIFAGSIRENILFTERFDAERYSMILRAFEIEREILPLPNGDDTLIDEFCLSEHFRMRIHLARCLYRKADIYLIDSCFASVKRETFEAIFDKFLKSKISIIATDQKHVADYTDGAITMRDSLIEPSDNFSLPEVETNRNSLEVTQEAFVSHQAPLGEDSESQISENIEWSSYRKYFKSVSSNKCGFLWLFLLFVLAQLNASGLELFISMWLNHGEMVPHRHVPSVNFTKTSTAHNDSFRGNGNEAFAASNYDNWVNFVYFYSIVLCTLLYFTVHRSFLFFQVCLRASVRIHDRLFCGVTRATMRFFECNSPRHILGHFTGDIEKLDSQLPTTIYDSIAFLFETLGIFALITMVNWWLLLPTLALVLAVFALRSCYSATAQSLRRVESLTHGSIHSRLRSTFHGLSTIRSTHSERVLMDEFHRNVDLNTAAMYLNLAATRAFALWLDTICALYICLVAATLLLLKSEDTRSGFVGMAITQALHLPFFLQWGVRQTVEVAAHMSSVERTHRYRYIATEAPLCTPNKHRPSKEWPTTPKIVFANLHMRHALNESDVLKDLNFKVNAGEKVGIVGARGAGKSAVVRALLRLAINEGRIEIDDINIDTLGLHDLRRCFGIIPANPMLFRGTMRGNLDPLERRSDEEIFTALECVGLRGSFTLSEEAEEQMMSVKQMQLVYIARALLAKNKILILDETTDALQADDANEIHDVIRRNFADCTRLVISQCLDTIMDSDGVLVLEEGRIVEIGHPYELIQLSRGHFRVLIDRTGYACAMNLIKIAERSYFGKK